MSDGTSDSPRPSAARRRVLDAATRLFYAEGIHAVGIDRVIAEAAVAKATFYNHFPSKDDLVRAYVEQQDQQGRAAIAELDDLPPVQVIYAIFDRYAQAAREPDYRGCPFLNAAAEYPDETSPIRQAVDEHRRWLRALFRDLIAASDDPHPKRTADILMVLADGLLIAGELDGPTRLRTLARDALDRVLSK
jgi:AcrR family transcriptional regulator